MSDTYVDTEVEVEVEVDSTELAVEVDDAETFEATLEEPGLEIEVEAEIRVVGDDETTDDGGENYEMATDDDRE